MSSLSDEARRNIDENAGGVGRRGGLAGQATGFEEVIPTGEDVLGFEAAEEAASGIETLLSDPDRHAKVAWALAEEYFDSAKVLPRLLEVALG